MEETTKNLLETTTNQLDTAISQVSTALKIAVEKYGADAVDLAVLVYRIEAIQNLVYGVFYLMVVFGMYHIIKHIIKWTDDGCKRDSEAAFMARIIGVGGSVATIFFSFVAGANHLTSVTNWAAAFGYPELMMARRALEAAGLL